MPVAKGLNISVRGAVLVGLTALIAAIFLGGTMWIILRQGNVELVLGDREFRAGNAAAMTAEIAQEGPILYADAGDFGQRDIILNHQGNDQSQGWVAFAARRAGDPRECYFQWDASAQLFSLTNAPGSNLECEDATSDAIGSELTQYPVEVREGELFVLLNEGN